MFINILVYNFYLAISFFIINNKKLNFSINNSIELLLKYKNKLGTFIKNYTF